MLVPTEGNKVVIDVEPTQSAAYELTGSGRTPYQLIAYIAELQKLAGAPDNSKVEFLTNTCGRVAIRFVWLIESEESKAARRKKEFEKETEIVYPGRSGSSPGMDE